MLHDLEEREKVFSRYPDKMLAIMPEYTLAVCPICKKKYIEKIDNYSIRSWTLPGNGEKVFFKCGEPVSKCEHFFAVQFFINLNGLKPELSEEEMRFRREFPPEAPHIQGNLFKEDVESYGVMHSIPLCRIEGDKFVPRYKVYTVTYFLPEDEEKRFMNMVKGYNKLSKKPYDSIPPEGESGKDWWDLEKWVNAGKLLWLEVKNNDFELKKGPVENFPYRHIEGRKSPYYQTIPPWPEHKVGYWIGDHIIVPIFRFLLKVGLIKEKDENDYY
jgi:hypothetical protein